MILWPFNIFLVFSMVLWPFFMVVKVLWRFLIFWYYHWFYGGFLVAVMPKPSRMRFG